MGQLLRRCVSVVVFVCVFAGAYAIESYTFHENSELGHARQTNGTVDWGPFPTPINQSSQEVEARSDGWDITVKFALAVVESVQTQIFPYDLLRRILRKEYSKNEVLGYQTNVIVVAAMGGALALAIVMAVVIYVLRRCRRGGKEEFLVHVSNLVARYHWFFLVVGGVFLVVDFILVLCCMITSTYALQGAMDLQHPIDDAMDDVIYYIHAMQQDYDFITNKTSQWLIKVLTMDMNDVGRLIWETGRDEFLPTINSTLQLTPDLDSKATQSLAYLSLLHTDMQSAVDNVVTTVDSVLTRVHFNLTTAITDYSCRGCDGSCSGCQAIVPNDIFLNVDFSLLPNISSNIANLASLLSTNISGTLTDPSYYFLYGIGEKISQIKNVTLAKDELIQGLQSWQNAWGNATENILYPNQTDFWFDTMRPMWNEFYEDLKMFEIARFAFVAIVCVLTVVVMVLTVVSVVVAAQRGLFTVQKSGEEDFAKPKKLLGWSLVSQMIMAASIMASAAGGFYVGANLEKAVCQPARGYGIAENVIDYTNAIPGHPGTYLSDVFLGNGTIGPVMLTDVLTSCANGSGAYSVFLQHLIVPNLQENIQNYTKHFNNLPEIFDRMRVVLPSDTNLVPPQFASWVGNYTLFSGIDFTAFGNMLYGNAINTDVDTFTANLQVIYDTAMVNGGPFEPAKSRLPTAIDLLQGQKANISIVETIQNNLAAIFSDYNATVTDILTMTNQTIEQLLGLEQTLISLSGPAISKGVDQYYAEFLATLDEATNTTWKWVGEAAPCEQISDAYDAAVKSFCDQYSDYVNASWLLLGHTCLFMLAVSVVTFVLYRSVPDPLNSTDDPLKVNARTRILMVEKKNEDTGPSMSTSKNAVRRKQGAINDGFDFTGDQDDDAGAALNSTRRQRRRSNRIDSWIDHRTSVSSLSGVVLQKNVMTLESLA